MADIENRSEGVEKAAPAEREPDFSAGELMRDAQSMRPAAQDVPRDIAGNCDLQLVSQGFRTNWASDGGATPAEARMAVNSQPGGMTSTLNSMRASLAAING